MPYQSVFDQKSGSSTPSTPVATGGYKSVFGTDTTWKNPGSQPTPTPTSSSQFPSGSIVSQQELQQTFPDQNQNIFSKISQGIQADIKNPFNIFDQIDKAASYIKTNIIDSPTVKAITTPISNAITSVANTKIGNTTVGNIIDKPNVESPFLSPGEKTSGNIITDVARMVLSNSPAFGVNLVGEAPKAFSASKAIMSGVLQSGVQLAAGARPSEIVKNLPIALAFGTKEKGDLISKLEDLQNTAREESVNSLPKTFTPKEAWSEVTSSNLVNTPFGKELLKTSIEADKTGNNIQVIHEPESSLKTPLGIPVKIDVVGENHAEIPQEITQGVVTRNINDLVTHEEAPDKETIAQYKNEIESGGKPSLVVIKEGDKWGVEDGKHKLEAYRELGITNIPTIEKAVSPVRHELQNIASIKSPDDAVLNPIIDQINGTLKSDEQRSQQGIQSENSNSQVAKTAKSSAPQNLEDLTQSSIKNEGQQNIESIGREDTGKSVPKLESSNNTKSEPVSTSSLRDGESVKPSTLGLKVEQTAIQKKLTTELKDLPAYETMNMKEEAQKAADLIKSDPQKAYDIALGKENPPKGLKAESVFKAIEASITTPEQANELAHSTLVREATEIGQRIKALDVSTSESPVEAIKQVINAREKALKERTGQTINQAITSTISDIKKSIDSSTAKKADWASFIKSIQC